MRLTVDWIACLGYALGAVILFREGAGLTPTQALTIFLAIAFMNIRTGYTHD